MTIVYFVTVYTENKTEYKLNYLSKKVDKVDSRSYEICFCH